MNIKHLFPFSIQRTDAVLGERWGLIVQHSSGKISFFHVILRLTIFGRVPFVRLCLGKPMSKDDFYMVSFDAAVGYWGTTCGQKSVCSDKGISFSKFWLA